MAEFQTSSTPYSESMSARRGGRLATATPGACVRGAPVAMGHQGKERNVGNGERLASIAAGSLLALLGLERRDLPGLIVAGVGSALVYRGAAGHCAVYERLGVNTARDDQASERAPEYGVRIRQSLLINKSPEELYTFWRNFENFPRFMSHLESVKKLHEHRSHWVAKAPSIYGGTVEWDAELTADEPNRRLDWRSLPGSDIDHRGSVRFERALGNRGTNVRVELDYDPPFGRLGRWAAKLFGEEPEVQMRDDLRRFQRLMEIGEVLTTDGQPQGTCARPGA